MQFGFGTDPFEVSSGSNVYTFQEMEYRTYGGTNGNGNEIYLYEPCPPSTAGCNPWGNFAGVVGNWNSSDTFKMTMDTSGIVRYFKNDVLMTTSTVPAEAGATYYGSAVGYTGSINNVTYTATVTLDP